MAEGGSHVNIFKNLEDNIKLVIQQIKDGESETERKGQFNPERYWEQLGVALKVLSKEGTKFSLAFTKPPFPAIKECEGMAMNMETTVLQLVSIFYSFPKTQGMTLRKQLQRAVLEILDSVLNLVTSLCQLDPRAGERKQATGTVWEGAGTFSSLPKNNCEAMSRTLEQSAALVDDALSEVEEIVNNDGRCEDVFGDTESDEVDNAEAWTAQDKEVVAPVKGLVKTVVKLLKKARDVGKAKAKCDSEAHIAQLDDLSDCAQRLSPAVDNLTSCLYAPMDYGTIKSNASVLSDVIKDMLQVLRHSHLTEEADNSWLDFLNKANSHNQTKLLNILHK